MPSWVWLAVTIGALIVAGIVFIGFVFTREAGRRRAFPLLRPLYKHVFNPGALQAAARGEARWGIVHHVGRRSGARYDTPVDAERTPGGVLIPLVYGAKADWCQNILSAGRCTLTLGGEELALTAPRVIDLSAAAPSLSAERTRSWRRIGIEHCLSLHDA
jgi:deazaflavin-dependent oxidoreductase (nitroreductase family)